MLKPQNPLQPQKVVLPAKAKAYFNSLNIFDDKALSSRRAFIQRAADLLLTPTLDPYVPLIVGRALQSPKLY